jgi:hypothetical protein
VLARAPEKTPVSLQRPQANVPEPSFTGLIDLLSAFGYSNIRFATAGIFIWRVFRTASRDTWSTVSPRAYLLTSSLLIPNSSTSKPSHLNANMAPAAVPEPVFRKDEKVYCFHHELLYEAKVLEVRPAEGDEKKNGFEYRVHYKGWKNTYVSPI